MTKILRQQSKASTTLSWASGGPQYRLILKHVDLSGAGFRPSTVPELPLPACASKSSETKENEQLSLISSVRSATNPNVHAMHAQCTFQRTAQHTGRNP